MGALYDSCCSKPEAIVGLSSSQANKLENGLIVNKSKQTIYYVIQSQLERQADREYHNDSEGNIRASVSLPKFSASASGQVKKKNHEKGGVRYQQVKGKVVVQSKNSSYLNLMNLVRNKHTITIYVQSSGTRLMDTTIIRDSREIRHLIKSKKGVPYLHPLNEARYFEQLKKLDLEDNREDQNQGEAFQIRRQVKLQIEKYEKSRIATQNLGYGQLVLVAADSGSEDT